MMYEQILDGREERYNLELKLLEYFKKPIMVITINYPGESKLDEISDIIFREAIRAIKGFKFIYITSGKNFAGHYFMGVISGDPIEAKKFAVGIEEKHPLGRLFDIDVIDYPFKKIERRQLGLKGRKCILCGGNSRECILEGRHTTGEVLRKIRSMVEAYLNGL
ncbi:MAG: holo-ACP synthase [Thermoanaerobacteraceae bacterium]|nr:holo-ACP synthase [Thermoanaerobacteraceae bacterium]